MENKKNKSSFIVKTNFPIKYQQTLILNLLISEYFI